MGLINGGWASEVYRYGSAVKIQSKIIFIIIRKSITIIRLKRNYFIFRLIIINCRSLISSIRCCWLSTSKKFCIPIAVILFCTSIFGICCCAYINLSFYSYSLDELYCLVWIFCKNSNSSNDDKINDLDK